MDEIANQPQQVDDHNDGGGGGNVDDNSDDKFPPLVEKSPSEVTATSVASPSEFISIAIGPSDFAAAAASNQTTTQLKAANRVSNKMKIVTVTPGRLGLTVEYGGGRGAVIKAISLTCTFRDKVRIGDQIVTNDGKRVFNGEDLRTGNDGVRQLGIIPMRRGRGCTPHAPAKTSHANANAPQSVIAGKRKRGDMGKYIPEEAKVPTSTNGGRRARTKVVSYKDESDSSDNDDEDKNIPDNSSVGSTQQEEQSHHDLPGVLAAPSFEIGQCSSLQQLDQHAIFLEELIRSKTDELQQVKERMEYLKNNKPPAKKRVRKRCTVEGCNNIAKTQGGICMRHSTKPKHYYCKIEGCTKKSQRGGLCARHGANIPRCKVEGCTSYAKKGGVCAKHGEKQGGVNEEKQKCHAAALDDEDDTPVANLSKKMTR